MHNNETALADQSVPTPGLSASRPSAEKVAGWPGYMRRRAAGNAMSDLQDALARMTQLQAACPSDFKSTLMLHQWDLLKDRVAKLDERMKTDDAHI